MGDIADYYLDQMYRKMVERDTFSSLPKYENYVNLKFLNKKENDNGCSIINRTNANESSKC